MLMRTRPHAVSAMARAKPPHTTQRNMGVSAARARLLAVSPSRTNLDSTRALVRQNR